MGFGSYMKDIEKKREEARAFRSLQRIETVFQKRKEEYARKAKEALKEGNKSQYAAYVALLKNAMFNLAQAQDMTANFIIARDLKEMTAVNKDFVNAINRMMKDVYKISKSIDVKGSRKIFSKAVDMQGYTATQLKQLLEDNNLSFQSSVNELSDITDSEIKSVLEAEIKSDEEKFADGLEKLEAEFAVLQAKPQQVRRAETLDGPQPPPRYEEKPAELKTSADSAEKEESYQPSKAVTEKAPYPQTNLNKQFNVEGIAFRPQRLDDYMGQPNAVETLKPAIKMARLRNGPLPHVLLCGSYGQGKTTLAKIIANEVGGRFTTISFKTSFKDMQKALRNLKPNDIVFIDEIHKLSTDIVEALLYPAMEDYEMNITESVKGRTKATTIKLPPFTLIGATTETGKLLKPFYSKFPLNVTLQEYELDVIAAIIKNSFSKSYINIADDLVYEIARRSRRLPRLANAFVIGVGDRTLSRLSDEHKLPDGAFQDEEAIKKLNAEVAKEDIYGYFKNVQIDEMGLKEVERDILKIIIEKYNGGPVGLISLTKAMNMSDNRIDQEYEPYLVKLGFLNIRAQGRFATDAAYKYLGYSRDEEQDESATPAEEAPKPVYGLNGAEGAETKNVEIKPEPIEAADDDDLPVTEGKIGEFDAEAAEWIGALFSGSGERNEASLDDIFPGADKAYDSIAKNRCILRVNGAEFYCDSVLERRFLSLLFAAGYITDARTEALELEYSSARMSGKRYFPDFVLKLHDGTVAIVEMKNLTSMGNHLNMAKYEALKAYCQNHGFKYAEVGRYGRRYVSAEQLAAEPVNEKLQAFVKSKVEEQGSCTLADLTEFGYDERQLVVLLLNDKTLKNVDRTGGNPQIVSAEE